MSLLSLERVTKRFDGIVAVDDVSFTIDRGQVVGFLGPNGAGKSTTMRMITQYFEPDGGSIRFDGTPLAEAGIEAKRRIGFLPENNPLYGEMLVAEYLDFVARLRDLEGPDRRRAIDEAVAATAIEAVYNRPISELSKGFRQRVGLAAAILHRPDLLVLDEPTEGLDPNQRVEIRQLISHLGRERTVILSTHVLGEVQYTCSRLLIINRGKIVADDAVDTLLTRATSGIRINVEATGAGVDEQLGALDGVRAVERHEVADGRQRFTVVASDDIRQNIFLLAKDRGWMLYELHHEAGNLEDLFRELTGAAS
ncbi:MAG TPA: ATP-binding cassette domain-containing protein [Gemmatimonadaceae bacterium]|jgi:ABC-2 type transport system ATP-binding protein|nr:ATP-binding cassette domain-containing protein [Gemmatimonadaceae bacterium]